ncbi:hypothetical protein OROGR_024956 [Orobanche gracilis]
MATTTVLLTVILMTTFLSAAASAAASAPGPHHPCRLCKTHPQCRHTLQPRIPRPGDCSLQPPRRHPHHHFRPHRLLHTHVPGVLPPAPSPRTLYPRTVSPPIPPLVSFRHQVESFAARRCLTVTASSVPAATKKVFINGVEITKPDLFNNGLYIVHAVQGFLSHLSPLSCAVETMSSLSFPQQPPPVAPWRRSYHAPDAKRRNDEASYKRIQYRGLSDAGKVHGAFRS